MVSAYVISVSGILPDRGNGVVELMVTEGLEYRDMRSSMLYQA